MDLLVLSPFSAATFEWTLAGGNPAVTVVCKLTFSLQPGTDAPLEAVQDPIVAEDRLDGAGDAATLVDASDLVPYKAGADVVLTGSAFAPPGRKASTVSTRLVVGAEVDKTLEVSGPRAWLADGRRQEPAPFDRVALRWQRAAGGAGTDNPAGLSGVACGEGQPAPQIVRPNAAADGSAPLQPAGFGPVAAAWPARAEKLGGAPRLQPGWASQPLAWTIDPAFFNVAPADQRLKVLRPNETIMLFGLLRDREKFGMRLPGVQPRAFALNGGAGGEGRDVPLVADTLWIDTDRERVSVTWRGQLPVGSTARRVVVVLQEREAALAWADVDKRLPSEARMIAAAPARPPTAMAPAAPSPPPPPAQRIASSPTPPLPVVPLPAPVAASAPMPTFIGRRPSDEPGPTRRGTPPATSPQPAARPVEPLDLLWFDTAVAPKLRANREWRALIDALELVASDDGAAGEDEDRREVFQVLARGDALDAAALAGALATAISPDGKLDPPLVVVAGEATLPFEASELLRLTLAACKPVASTDKAFAEVVATVGAMAEAAALSDAVAHGLTWRLREAFQQVKHTLPARYLESTAERALLDGRRYARREVFGAPHFRALIGPAPGDAAPAYLPVGVASRLPLFPRFAARLVAELHAQVDHDEAHPCALRVVAIARALPKPGPIPAPKP